VTPTTLLRRIAEALAIAVLAAIALAGGYAETHRVPGQP
jgi:hypothetical protein